MGLIFRCRTTSAFIIKVLAELLNSNLNTACFEIDKNGIFLTMYDEPKTVLIDLKLYAENFQIFKFKNKKKMYLGITLGHFYKMLKSIKKKDTIELFIDSNNLTELGIMVKPKDKDRTTTSYIKIQEIQHLCIQLCDKYKTPIIIPSSAWYKIIKDMNQIGNKVYVISNNKSQIIFKCDKDGLIRREEKFGGTDNHPQDTDSEDDDDNNEYKEFFRTDQFTKITKIQGLSTDLKIFPVNNLPLLFQSQVGQLGIIKIYVKSQSQIEQPVDTNNEDLMYDDY